MSKAGLLPRPAWPRFFLFRFRPAPTLAFLQAGAVRIMLSTLHLAAKMPDHGLWIGFLKNPDG